MDKNILGSLLALETSSVLSIIVFLSLIRPSFYYSKRVIFTCFFVTLFWFVVTIYSIIKRKKEEKGLKAYIISAFIYLVVTLYMIRTVWFYSYLTLAPEYSFFNGLCHNDTFYLSGLCESIKNYGYPALLTQGLDYHKYHYFSIFMLAVVSKIVRIPCLITYCYLYPVVFFPLFSYLFFQAIGVIREYLNKNNIISIIDVFFSLFVIIGFLPLRYLNSISLGLASIFISESFCVSIILLLMYVVVISKFKKKKNSKIIIYYLISPLFIFIVTASKISVGIIFFIFLIWVYIRKEGIKLSSFLSMAFGSVVFLLSLSLFLRAFQNINGRSLTWFHFIKTFVPHKNIISHLFFLFFPALLFFSLSKKTQYYKCYYKTNNAILSEAALIITFCSILPGNIIEIEGGSAAYFFLPALFISLFLLLCSSELQDLFTSITKTKKVLVLLLFIVIYGESYIYDSYYGSTLLKANPRQIVMRYQMGKQGNKQVIKSCFYKSLTNINKLTEGNKRQYCLIVSDDCDIFKLYKGNHFFLGDRGLFAITAYLGMPVVTDLERAKEMQIENVIILENNTYRIISLE